MPAKKKVAPAAKAIVEETPTRSTRGRAAKKTATTTAAAKAEEKKKPEPKKKAAAAKVAAKEEEKEPPKEEEETPAEEPAPVEEEEEAPAAAAVEEEEEGDEGGEDGETPAKKSRATPPGKKIFFNHRTVQDTIWKALSNAGWTTDKPYKTQRNYHPPPKTDGSKTRVFDSIGRVMDFIRIDPDWKANAEVQKALAEYESASGMVGGSTALTPSRNKGMGTPRTRKTAFDHVDKVAFMDVVWKAMEGEGWKMEAKDEKEYFTAPDVEGATKGDDDEEGPIESIRKVMTFLSTDDNWKENENIKFALMEYDVIVEEKEKKKRKARKVAELDENGKPKKKVRKTPSGLNKPRPHKFSNPIMQDTLWKALAESGWTTSKRPNSSQRNYYPPKGSGSRKAVYQTITAVIEYIRSDMEWMLNEPVQAALKEYDRRLAFSYGDRAGELGLEAAETKEEETPAPKEEETTEKKEEEEEKDGKPMAVEEVTV